MAFSNRPRVIILGAGFAGLAVAQALAFTPAEPRPHVVLVDRNNYHTFSPLLYRVATTAFEPQEAVFPLRPLVSSLPGIEFHLGQVQQVDLNSREVTTGDRSFSYDYLVLALGSAPQVTVPGGSESALPLKTLEQAIAIRNQIIRAVERASRSLDAAEVRRLLTFVIVGGGTTGVEFAAALHEFVRGYIRRQFPGLESQCRVMLMESAGRLLPDLPQAMGEQAHARLRQLGVQVLVGTRAAEITPQGVYLRRGMLVPSAAVVWTGGVRGNPAVQRWGLTASRKGKLPVLRSLQVAGRPEVYVAGELASFEEEAAPPMTAAVARSQGRSVAKNILRQTQGEAPLPWSANGREMIVTVGRRWALAQHGSRLAAGLPGWLRWAGANIPGLIPAQGGRTLAGWAFKHLRADSGSRIILPTEIEPSLEQLELFDDNALQKGNDDL